MLVDLTLHGRIKSYPEAREKEEQNVLSQLDPSSDPSVLEHA